VSAGALIIVVVGLIAVWLLFVQPAKRRQRAQREMLETIEPGQEILTAGGIYATVVEANGDELTIELAPGTKVRLDRRAVAAVLGPEGADEEPVPEEPTGENPS